VRSSIATRPPTHDVEESRRVIENRELYDVRSASRRVKRSRWTIYHWMRQGMTFRSVGGRRYVEHEVLLAALRLHCNNEKLHRFTRRTEQGL
jgi:hypothetical protein